MMQDIVKALRIKETTLGTSTGAEWIKSSGKNIVYYSSVDAKKIATVTATDEAADEAVVQKAQQAFLEWRTWPSPKRGEVVGQVSEALRKNKEALGKLVSYEMGKSLQEGYGEVQEM